MVATYAKVSTGGDKSSCLGIPFLLSNFIPSNQNEGVTTSESCTNVATTILKSGFNSNPMVATNTQVSTIGENSSYLVHHFCQAMSCPQIRMRVLIQMNHG